MQFKLTKIPQKITPCPIVEAVVELRYKPVPGIPKEAIPGLLFTKLSSSNFLEFSKLPITEIPEFMRDNDPTFKYAALYASKHKDIPNLRFQFGPRSCSLVCGTEYIGWNTLQQKLQELLEHIKTVNIVQEVERLGLRYISFFEKSNIFNNTHVKIHLAENSMLESDTTVKSEFSIEDFTCTLQMSSTALLANEKKGSIIDIDIYQNFPEDSTFQPKEFIELANKAHDIEKNVFFCLLKDDYLKQFSPEYE